MATPRSCGLGDMVLALLQAANDIQQESGDTQFVTRAQQLRAALVNWNGSLWDQRSLRTTADQLGADMATVAGGTNPLDLDAWTCQLDSTAAGTFDLNPTKVLGGAADAAAKIGAGLGLLLLAVGGFFLWRAIK